MAPRPLIALLVLVSSIGPAVPTASGSGCVTLDDFSQGRLGEFPLHWKPRKESGRPVYSIREEGGRRFLRGIARRIGIQAGLEVGWDLADYPILAWSWRPIEFPKGSDERRAGGNDSAAAVYAVFPTSRVSLKSLKYIWSWAVPVGTHLTSSAGNTQVRVLRSGGSVGQWIDERVNVLEDYHRYFGGSEVPKPVGIAVLTDSDDVQGIAQGDYANFRVCKP